MKRSILIFFILIFFSGIVTTISSCKKVTELNSTWYTSGIKLREAVKLPANWLKSKFGITWNDNLQALFTSSTLSQNGFEYNGNEQAGHNEEDVTEIIVHLDRNRQTIEGFGGALITFGRERKEHYDPQFYDIAVNDLGVSMIRLPMPDFFEPFNDDDDPDNFNWDGFKVKEVDGETGLDYRMMILQEFKKRGVERFMASPWSAPAFTKSDRTTRNSGYLRMDKTDEFAESMAAFIIMAKHNWDIDIGAVTLQNELLFNHTFGSGLYSAYHLREATRSVMRKFKKEGINTLMLLPEDMTSVNRLIEYMQPVMDDPETKHYPGHLASHRQDRWDGVRKWKEHTAGWNRQNWMTETSGHPQTWPGAIQMASDMHSYLVGGDFSTWVYWQLSDNERSGQYAIMVDYKPTPKFYAARHFYRYIRPGAVRVETTPERDDILPSVFRHDTDGTLTLVYINPGNHPVKVYTTFKGGVHPKQFNRVISTESQGGKGNGTVEMDPVQSGETIVLPPMSIVTLFGEDKNLKTSENEHKWPEAVDLSRYKSLPEKIGDWSDRKNGDGWLIGMAASRNGIDQINMEIENGHLNALRYDGMNALTRAIMGGAGEAAQLLIKAGINVNQPSHDGWTPLHMAAATFGVGADNRNIAGDYTRTDLLDMVLEAGADIHATTESGWTPLHAAAASSWRDEEAPLRMKMLIDKGADVHQRDRNKRTPLHYAAMQGFMFSIKDIRPDIAEVLLSHGADVNAQDIDGNTPLHYAAKMSHERITGALMLAGADPHLKNNEGLSSVDWASKRNEPLVFQTLNGERPAHMALAGGAAEMVSKGDGHLGMELIRAAWNGDLKLVENLISKKADVFFMDGDGFTALERARDGGHWDIVAKIREEQLKREQKE